MRMIHTFLATDMHECLDYGIWRYFSLTDFRNNTDFFNIPRLRMSALLEKESHLHEHELGIPEGMILTGEKAKCHLVSQKCRMDCLVIGHLLLGRKPGLLASAMGWPEAPVSCITQYIRIQFLPRRKHAVLIAETDQTTSASISCAYWENHAKKLYLWANWRL